MPTVAHIQRLRFASRVGERWISCAPAWFASVTPASRRPSFGFAEQ